MIATLSKTNELLNKYNLNAKKKFGQNFLIDSNVVLKIIDQVKIDKNTGVIEIGPGLGSMTEILLSKAGKVLCYEIDQDMINILNNELKNDNLKIINKDILKSDIKSDLDYFKGLDRVVCVSNLPYYITTPIVFKLLEESSLDEICVMVQKEVALRFTAFPKTKDYGSLTVIIKYKTECNYAFTVSRNCFYPRPNVDSAILVMKRVKRDLNVNNELNFQEFIQKSFSMKRKTFINNILSNYSFDRDFLIGKLEECNLPLTIRSEELTLEELAKLYKLLLECE